MAEIIPHWLTKQANLIPDKLALEIDEEISITFRELHTKSKLMARRLASIDLKPGNRVAILSANSLDMLITLHALSYLDVIVVLLNTRLTSKELKYQLKNSDTKLLVTTKYFLENKDLEMDQIKTFNQIKKLPTNESIILNELIDLSKLWTIMYTSGTTGLPKAVAHTYGNHWWSAISSGLNLGIHADDKWLSPLPMFHVGGLSVFIKSVIYGMPVYLLPHYTKERLYKVIYEQDITIASLVTLMLADFIEQSKNRKAPRKLRTILLGGGSVPKILLDKAKSNRLPLFQSYGMTETSSQIVTLSPADNIRKLGSAGKPLLSAEIKVDAPDNEVGEIIVRGPMVINEYFNNKDATEASFSSGWLKTGDLGYLDGEGFLYIVDRRSDLIISGGENVYPTEVESKLLDHPNIKEVAVVKQANEKYGHVPVAFIVLEDKKNEPDLKSYLKNELARYKQPKKFYYIDELPRTASNKVKRFELEEHLKR